MRRAARALSIVLSFAALGAIAPDAGASGAVRCAPGSQLRGRLSERSTTCATARRVAGAYFRESRPGEHVGSLIVHGFYCEASYRARAFHISCYRRHARIWFSGTA